MGAILRAQFAQGHGARHHRNAACDDAFADRSTCRLLVPSQHQTTKKPHDLRLLRRLCVDMGRSDDCAIAGRDESSYAVQRKFHVFSACRHRSDFHLASSTRQTAMPESLPCIAESFSLRLESGSRCAALRPTAWRIMRRRMLGMDAAAPAAGRNRAPCGDVGGYVATGVRAHAPCPTGALALASTGSETAAEAHAAAASKHGRNRACFVETLVPLPLLHEPETDSSGRDQRSLTTVRDWLVMT